MKDTAELFASVDALKARLDAHRPLPADIVSQIRQDMRIRFTYHSNAIEGNTLTMSETKAVLEDGITILPYHPNLHHNNCHIAKMAYTQHTAFFIVAERGTLYGTILRRVLPFHGLTCCQQ